MSEFDYDAFTQQLKVKLAEDKNTPEPSRTQHREHCGDPCDPLTASNSRHIRAAVRAYAAERAASNEPLLKVETHRVSSFLVPGYCSMPDDWTETHASYIARPGSRDESDVLERAHKVGLLREGWTKDALSKRIHGNATKAHRLVAFVGALRGAAAAEKCVDALQTAHFAEGRAPSDPALLDAAAVAGGTSKFVVRRFLQTRELEKEVAQMADAVDRSVARDRLPALIVDGELAVEGPHFDRDAVLAALRACPEPTGARAFPPPARRESAKRKPEPLDVPPPTHLAH